MLEDNAFQLDIPEGPGPGPKKLAAYTAAVNKTMEANKALRSLSAINQTGSPAYNAPSDKDITNSLRTINASITNAKQVQDQEYAKVQDFIENDFMKPNLNTETYKQFLTTNAAGKPQVDDGKILDAVTLWGKNNGADGNVVNSIASQVHSRMENTFVVPKAEEIAKKEIEMYQTAGMLNTVNTDKYKSAIADVSVHLKSTADAVRANYRKSVDSRVLNLKSEFSPVVNSTVEKYTSIKDDIALQTRNDIIMDSQFRVDQMADQLSEQISLSDNPDIMYKAAQSQMNMFTGAERKKNEQTFNSPEFANLVNNNFEQAYGEQFKAEFEDINKEYVSRVQEIDADERGKYKDKIAQINDIGKQAFEKLGDVYSKLDPQSEALVSKIYQDAYKRVYGERIKEQADETEKQFLQSKAIADTLGLGAAVILYRKFFGDSFVSNTGQMMKSMGYALNSQGMDGEFTDWLKGKGGSLFSENFRYNPDLKGWNFMAPAFALQSMGQLAYSAPGMLAGLALAPFTGGSSAAAAGFALVSTAQNGMVNAGDTYEQYLQSNPGDIAGASEAAHKMFALNMLNLPFEATLGKLWFGKKTLSSLLKGAASEYITESYESSVQQSLLAPKSGNLAVDIMHNMKSKQAIEEGTVAAYSTLLTGGGASIFGRVKSALEGKSNPGTQFLTGHIFDRSSSYAKALFAGQEADYKPKTMDAIISHIDRLEVAVKDAKSMGMTKAQTLLYAELSEKAHAEKVKLEGITNPAMREKQEAKVKKVEDEMGKIVDGTAKVAVINVAGTQVAMDEKEAEKIIASPTLQEAVKQGLVTIDTENKDIIAALQAAKDQEVDESGEQVESPVMSAIIDNVDSIVDSTPQGKAVTGLLQSGAAVEKVVEQVVTDVVADPVAAEKAYGPEIVQQTQAEIAIAALQAAKVDEEVVNEQVNDTVEAVTNIEPAPQEQAAEVPEVSAVDQVGITSQSGEAVADNAPGIDERIRQVGKPDIGLKPISADKLASAPDPVATNRKHKKLMKEKDQITALLECLWKQKI